MVKMAVWRSVPVVTVSTVLLSVLLCGVVQCGVLSEVKEAEADNVVKRRAKRDVNEYNLTDKDGHPNGAVYISWGRKNCPDDAHLLYNGVMASGCNYPMQMICLANEPTWYPNQTTHGQELPAGRTSDWYTGDNMCGAEYFQSLLDVQQFDNAPCAVCQIRRRTSLVIPGRTICVGSWTLEYYGYLMVNQENMGVTPVCVDINAVADRSGTGSRGQAVSLQHAVPSCESLPCTPYVVGKAITCVVCSK